MGTTAFIIIVSLVYFDIALKLPTAPCARRCSTRGASPRTTWCRTWWPSWTTWSVWARALRRRSPSNSTANASNTARNSSCTARPTRRPSVWSAGSRAPTGESSEQRGACLDSGLATEPSSLWPGCFALWFSSGSTFRHPFRWWSSAKNVTGSWSHCTEISLVFLTLNVECSRNAVSCLTQAVVQSGCGRLMKPKRSKQRSRRGLRCAHTSLSTHQKRRCFWPQLTVRSDICSVHSFLFFPTSV